MYRDLSSLIWFDNDFYVTYFWPVFVLCVVSDTDMKQTTFGKRLGEVRKDKKMSQDELAKKMDLQGAVIGRYERDEVKPSIEVAAKIAQVLGVSLDYLVGNTDLLLDTNILNRISEIQKLSSEEQKTVFSLLDAFLRDTKTRKAYAA
jgi:transcriptional regulator with XRE-family HTH domain